MDIRQELETLAIAGKVEIKYFENSQDEEYTIESMVVHFSNKRNSVINGSFSAICDKIRELKKQP